MTLLNVVIVLITLPLVCILLLGAFRFYREGPNELKAVSIKREMLNSSHR